MFENVDGRTTDGRTDARVTGILIAHLGAFGSGELKLMHRIRLFCYIGSGCFVAYANSSYFLHV